MRRMQAMTVYLASPVSQLQCDACRGRPVLLSYGARQAIWAQYVPSFSNVLLDSGAYSELNSGKTIDGHEYADWAASMPWADAWAGIDDIAGNWKRSLANYQAYGGFPTFHDTDPPELLEELVAMAREGQGWLGIGLKPPRMNRRDFLVRTLERIPSDIHIHGFAMCRYMDVPGFASMDSTHWWREAMKYRQVMRWLTYGECLEIAVKKIERMPRLHSEAREQTEQML